MSDEELRMDAEMMSIMVDDWLADHADEFEDDPLALDGGPMYNEDTKEWVQEAHDSTHVYILAACDGDVYIAGVLSRR